MPAWPREFAGLPPAVSGCMRAAGKEFRAAARRDPAGFGRGLDRLLRGAARLFGCPAGEALFLTGFDKRDTTPARLEAALAELRAALYLESEGFSAIRPMPRAAGRTADLAAERGGKKYVFEVRWVSGGFGPEPAKRLKAKCRRKAAQAGTAARKSGASARGVVLVEGVLSEVKSSGRLAETALAVSPAANGAHVCLLSGGDSAVYPPWG